MTGQMVELRRPERVVEHSPGLTHSLDYRKEGLAVNATRTSAMYRFTHRFAIDENGCWIWLGSTATSGYPQMSIDGRHTAMHRWSYEAFVGPIPEGMLICHRCDVKRCVNPVHLEVGTVSKNTLDAIARGLFIPHNSLKTKCIHGHDLPPRDGVKRRQCQTCNRLRQQTPEYKKRRAELWTKNTSAEYRSEGGDRG